MANFENIDVVHCHDDMFLNEVMKLRYHICWEEFGRYSPHLDHDKKIVRDEFDGTLVMNSLRLKRAIIWLAHQFSKGRSARYS